MKCFIGLILFKDISNFYETKTEILHQLLAYFPRNH